MKKLNLKMKMLLYIGMVAFISFAVTIGVVAVKAGKMAKEDAMEKTTEIAHHYGGIAKAEIEVALDAARTLALTFEGMKNSGRVPERKVLDQIIKQVLQGTPSLFMVWTCWEPDALDGKDSAFANTPGHDASGRYARYAFRSGNHVSVDGIDDTEIKEANYYSITKRAGTETIIEPYSEVIDNKKVLMSSLCVPIRFNGKIVGVAGADITLESFQEQFSKVKVFETGYLSVISNKGQYISHPKSKRLGQPILKNDPWARAFMGDIKSGDGFVTANHSTSLGEPVSRVCVPVEIGHTGTPWAVMVSVPMSRVLKKAKGIQYTSMGIGTAAMALLMATIFLIVSTVTGPIKKGVAFAENMATGDFSKTLEINQQDEIGTLADALNNMTGKLGGMINEISAGVETLSSSSTGLAAISAQMSQGANETSEKSGTVAASAEEMSAGMTSIAAAMEQASTNVSMVATASEEMTSTINEVAKTTESTRNIADTAVSEAKTASDKIAELGAAAREIGNVTETITDISEQTNLLALNATIEAARAGEAGKGFAVVAAEIKELARLTTEATNDIREKITGIQQATSISVESIGSITKIIDDISDMVSTTATAIEEQAATTQEIAGNVAQASQGLTEINENVAQGSRVSEEITADISEVSRQSMEMTNSSSTVNLNAEELLALAEKLKEMVGHFKV
ncbi:MAG: methyl-accepting chemotaxis protein [Desulfobacteraceae bacterium]|nr:methyl-accepting chemotaxis protein [Desulfobacteraceae bacterium]